MQSFEFYTPTKIFFGRGYHKKTGEIIKEYGFKKVLVHYGQGSVKKNGILDEIIASLEESDIEYVELPGAKPNPVLGKVKEGAKICRKENIDLVLAVGGGSVMDSSKAIGSASLHPDIDPWKFFAKEIVPKKALPVGTILTIASSGSEMSASSVITNEELNLKRGFNADVNRPLFSIMNPEITFTVSPYQTACGVVDILMHTIERYFQTGDNAKLTHEISEALMRNVIQAGIKVMDNLKDYDARATLMWAGSLSHNDLTGVGKTKGLSVHQLEHEISAQYPRVAHAAGLSVLFPAWAQYVYKSDVLKFCRFAVNVWGCEMDYEKPQDTALEGIMRCKDYFSSTLKMPVSLREMDIGEEYFEQMAIKCTNYGKRKISGIIELDKNEIMDIYKLSL